MGAAVAVLLILVVGVLAAAIEARPVALAMVSRRIGRPVRVDGPLSIRPGLSGLTVRFTRLHVDQPAWAGGGAMVWIDQGVVVLPWTVLVGDGRIRDLELGGLRLVLRRDAGGRANWADAGSGKAPRPPRLGRLGLRGGVLDYQDLGRALAFRGAVTAATGPSGVPVLSVDGEGWSEGAPWSAHLRTTTDFTGATPYVLTLHLAVDRGTGPSAADFQGRFFAGGGGRLEGTLTGSGPNLHDLAHLINVPLPGTPTYSVKMLVAGTDKGVELRRMIGRVGASDVTGALTITHDPPGRRVEGDLHSRSLRISDLLAVISGGQLTRTHRAGGRLLPDAPINAAPLRNLSGGVRFSAASVQAPTTPTIHSLTLNATFAHGRVAAEPMVLTLAHGRAVVRFVLDVRGPTPKVRFDAVLSHADTADFSHAGNAPIRASFDGAVQLAGAGASLDRAASHASGEVRLRALDGRLQPVQAAVLSANLTRGVIALLSKSHAPVAMQCAVARFQVADGKARATHLHMNTAAGGVAGYGGFDLGAETIDLTLRPSAPGPVDVASVRIDGPLSHPRATLALDNPTGVVRRALTGLLHPAARPAVKTTSCG